MWGSLKSRLNFHGALVLPYQCIRGEVQVPGFPGPIWFQVCAHGGLEHGGLGFSGKADETGDVAATQGVGFADKYTSRNTFPPANCTATLVRCTAMFFCCTAFFVALQLSPLKCVLPGKSDN